ncbi:hypothetical protein BASA84_000504 [Batrachochytrium salamandrivorans]|nr:hypothetical protein BASA84_000504 [Batrachochytrium salamandrivorans]
MQFLHLFSFVVVASYAAALPQPAELSEKYSNNADPMDLAHPPSFVKAPKRPLDNPFTYDDFSSEKLAFTIDWTRNGLTGLFEKGESAGKKIGKYAGCMLIRCTRRDAYVNVLLVHWIEFVSTNVFNFIKAGLGDDKFSVVGPELVKKIKEFKSTFSAGSKEAVDATSNILTKRALLSRM